MKVRINGVDVPQGVVQESVQRLEEIQGTSVQGAWLEGLQEMELILQELWMKLIYVVCKWVGLGRGSYSRRSLRHCSSILVKKRVAGLLLWQLLRGVAVPRLVICFHLLKGDYVRFVSCCSCSGPQKQHFSLCIVIIMYPLAYWGHALLQQCVWILKVSAMVFDAAVPRFKTLLFPGSFVICQIVVSLLCPGSAV